MDIFIKGREIASVPLHAGRLMVKGAGLQNLVYGTSGRRGTVQPSGITSRLWPDLSHTAFISRRRRRVKMYITHFRDRTPFKLNGVFL